VRLLRDLPALVAPHGLVAGDLLPMPGCDPGSLVDALPGWQQGSRRAAMAAKTGTLIRDDGGVATLAGYIFGRDATALYMVAAPRSGTWIGRARRDIEAWANAILDRVGGPAPGVGGAPVVATDADAETAWLAAAGSRGS